MNTTQMLLYMMICNSMNPHDKIGLGYSNIPCIIEPSTKRLKNVPIVTKLAIKPLNVTLGKEFL